MRIALVALIAGCGGDPDPELSDADRTMIADSFASFGQDTLAVDLVELSFSQDLGFSHDLVAEETDEEAIRELLADKAAASGPLAAARLGSCVETAPGTRSPTVQHTLTSCQFHGHGLTGDVFSTWALEDECLKITHLGSNLRIDGAPTELLLTVHGCELDGNQLRRRELAMSASLGETGDAISLVGAWTATYDATSGCVVREGRVDTTFDSHDTLQRVERGVTACVNGNGGGVPQNGESLDAIEDGTFELIRFGKRVVVSFDRAQAIEILASTGDRFATTQALD
jgi:hypothetical protein